VLVFKDLAILWLPNNVSIRWTWYR